MLYLICVLLLKVTLEAEVTNKGALALYGRLGFIRAKRLFRYYLNGVDAFRLKLLFPQPQLHPSLPMMACSHDGDCHDHHLPEDEHSWVAPFFSIVSSRRIKTDTRTGLETWYNHLPSCLCLLSRCLINVGPCMIAFTHLSETIIGLYSRGKGMTWFLKNEWAMLIDHTFLLVNVL